MAINKKRKRTIIINQRTYLWWGFWEFDQTRFNQDQIKIVSEDQKISFHYGLNQVCHERHLYVALRNSPSIVLKCPQFENDARVISSGGINSIVIWTTKTLSFDLDKLIDEFILNPNQIEEIAEQVKLIKTELKL
jgi:phosphorylcholine metabolism protein LicD